MIYIYIWAHEHIAKPKKIQLWTIWDRYIGRFVCAFVCFVFVRLFVCLFVGWLVGWFCLVLFGFVLFRFVSFCFCFVFVCVACLAQSFLFVC